MTDKQDRPTRPEKPKRVNWMAAFDRALVKAKGKGGAAIIETLFKEIEEEAEKNSAVQSSIEEDPS